MFEFVLDIFPSGRWYSSVKKMKKTRVKEHKMCRGFYSPSAVYSLKNNTAGSIIHLLRDVRWPVSAAAVKMIHGKPRGPCILMFCYCSRDFSNNGSLSSSIRYSPGV